MDDGASPSGTSSATDLRALLQRDTLTGLHDAAAFEVMVADRQRAGGGDAAIGLIELHGLARYNDFQGRTQGDELIVSVARRLDRLARDEFGPSVIVARISGARFALLPSPRTAVERLRVEVRAIAGAIGDALIGKHGDQLSLRIAVGSVAAGDATASGIALVARRLAAPPALVRAIDIEAAAAGIGLAVLFQPQFAFVDERLIGAEALVRWQHPRLGEVGGAVLFAAAAAAGLERKLSRAVWAQALQSMAGWPAALRSTRVALNITAADVAAPEMADELIAMAAAAGIDCARLTVEVTEAALIERLDMAAQSLARLRAAGMHAALDDFGTGYSGLAWLRQLPVDYIKIDSGFARDASGGERERTVLRGVIDIARALDLDVLAEGVESEEQRERLKALGCRWYQGYLRSPALGDSAFVAFADGAMGNRLDG